MSQIGLRFIAIFFLLLTTSCSPFGNNSLIQKTGLDLSGVLDTKTTTEMNSGSTQIIETNPANPSQNYKVNYSVGATYGQTATMTNGGYQVTTSIQQY
jgi:hypothetical protein